MGRLQKRKDAVDNDKTRSPTSLGRGAELDILGNATTYQPKIATSSRTSYLREMHCMPIDVDRHVQIVALVAMESVWERE
jgi:hypothetical protein